MTTPTENDTPTPGKRRLPLNLEAFATGLAILGVYTILDGFGLFDRATATAYCPPPEPAAVVRPVEHPVGKGVANRVDHVLEPSIMATIDLTDYVLTGHPTGFISGQNKTRAQQLAEAPEQRARHLPLTRQPY